MVAAYQTTPSQTTTTDRGKIITIRIRLTIAGAVRRIIVQARGITITAATIPGTTAIAVAPIIVRIPLLHHPTTATVRTAAVVAHEVILQLQVQVRQEEAMAEAEAEIKAF